MTGTAPLRQSSRPLLRVYDPAECDSAGVPLDWERCRGLDELEGGMGSLHDAMEQRNEPCPRCDGHGSLKAAALAMLMKEPREAVAVRIAADDYNRTRHPADSRHLADAEARLREVRWVPEARCEDCGHPMSDGTWERVELVGTSDRRLGYPPESATLRVALDDLRTGAEPTDMLGVHYSPCDEGCRHDPITRAKPVTFPLQASWRSVDVRTLGWPHDLRPENLAVLCLRCWGAR